MADLPKPIRTRSTQGSQRLADYAERHGVRPVAWYVPEFLHEAVSDMAVRNGMTMQTLITFACETRYGLDTPVLPPLVPPSHTKTDPHKNVTWYAPVDLYKKIKQLALDIESTAQQLITSAVVDQYKNTKEIKALRLVTGAAPYARAPIRGELSLQRPEPKAR